MWLFDANLIIFVIHRTEVASLSEMTLQFCVLWIWSTLKLHCNLKKNKKNQQMVLELGWFIFVELWLFSPVRPVIHSFIHAVECSFHLSPSERLYLLPVPMHFHSRMSLMLCPPLCWATLPLHSGTMPPHSGIMPAIIVLSKTIGTFNVDISISVSKTLHYL